MNLTDAKNFPIKRKHKFPVGRGKGTGIGKTCGRGGRGQYARSGVSRYAHWEGGQTPLVRKLPKRGFSNFHHTSDVATVNLGDLGVFNAGDVVDPAKLQAAGLIHGEHEYVKILGGGELTKPLTIKAHAFASSVAAKAKKAGATLEVIPSDRKEKLDARAKKYERMAAAAAEKEKGRLARKEERAKIRAEKKAKKLAGAKAEGAPKKDAPKAKDKAAKPKGDKPHGGGKPPAEKK